MWMRHITDAFLRHSVTLVTFKSLKKTGKMKLAPGPTLRLMCLCTPLFVASPYNSASLEYPSANSSLADGASSSADMVPPPTENTPPPLADISDLPTPSDEVEHEPSTTSGANSLGREQRKYSKTELCDTVASVAAVNNLPVGFFSNLIHQESGFKPHVISPVGAQGIAQFMPRVAASYGLANPFDPIAALTASGKLLAELVDQFGNLGLAAAAYNAGPKRVQDWLSRKRGWPAETRNYVQSITGRAAEHWLLPGEKQTELSFPPRARCPELRIAAQTSNELVKTPELPAKLLSRPIIEEAVKVRRSMPQPSQFAMGLPVSRFAAMATPLPQTKAHQRGKTRRPSSRVPLDTVMKEFVSTPTPTIMVEEKTVSRSRSSARLKAAEAGPAGRVRIAVAR